MTKYDHIDLDAVIQGGLQRATKREQQPKPFLYRGKRYHSHRDVWYAAEEDRTQETEEK